MKVYKNMPVGMFIIFEQAIKLSFKFKLRMFHPNKNALICSFSGHD